MDTNFQSRRPEKLNVWTGIFGNQGSFFLISNLIGEVYSQLLQETVKPILTETVKNANRHYENTVIFQQDRDLSHYAQPLRHVFDATFPGIWTERRGATQWPSQSPDLPSLDFFARFMRMNH